MSAIITFVSKAPTFMALLMEDFGFDELDAAAIMGNLGHESGGLSTFQERSPTVPGSKGGWGWAQWTGSRRRDFESYAKRNGYDLRSDEANYKQLYRELSGASGASNESAAVGKTKAAKGLEAKVKAFEQSYERAGVKHYPSRLKWAERALDAFRASDSHTVAADPVTLTLTLSDISKDELIDALLEKQNIKSVLVDYGKS